ncbi:hypothetical protein N7532_010321 [Penicillium argentinense]|uniref:KOW domain-containing protein n=1 Tax=Penicillium argentinense TaxID=1131581 RepID=A0A9W9EPK3_9EURO|nr:uncharacterized protein N7532_010321 [Penicillium argentinense]KAJ5085550.1 hypothetical protein N7532_010321 [Penicillium argentinense]
MQKVIQRTATARKQAQKKIFRASRRDQLADRKDNIRVRRDYNKAMIDSINAARTARWEDWQKGAIAPKRDSGPEAHTFGAVDSALIHPPAIPKGQRRKHILFAAGDRVCVVRGREAGKINEITQVNEESETVLIKDVNTVDIKVPEWAKHSMGIKTDVLAQTLPIPMDDIRHVIALSQESENGISTTRDHIVQHAYAGYPHVERPAWSKLPRFTRYISGIDVEIPWPTESAPEVKDGEYDTLRYEVDQETWVPSLDNAPFPSSVLDELRNKYSRFRTRHDPEYVKEKVMEEYRQQYLASQSLLTPPGERKEFAIAKSKAAKQEKMDANGNMLMDDETRTFINRFMQTSLGEQPRKAGKAKKAAGKAPQTA